jgi:2-methylcitrate dehydratase PrpD
MTDNPIAATPIEAYGAWVAETPNDWPEDALHSAHREFIDTIAVTIPGADEPAARLVFKTVSAWGSGDCTAAGHAEGLSAPFAALVNGTAGHALDFDDNFDPPKAHASTVLVPSILALGEQEDLSGEACIDAYVVGLQIMGRVGQGVNPHHRNRGWHATGTMGAIGAAAACARLLQLDAEQAAFCLSISTSMAAGFMSQFGTMTKPMHAGLAAKAGIMAASFAANGVTAGLETLDGRTGLNRLMVGADYEELRDGHTNPEHGQTMIYELDSIGAPLLITEHGFRVKRFPMCGVAHRGIDGVLEMKAEHGLMPDDIARIDIIAPQVHLNNLMHNDPKGPLEAKFSMEYGVSVALLTGDCTLADFTPEAVMRPAIRGIYPRIHLQGVDKSEGEFPTQIKLTHVDGRVFETSVGLPKGSKVAPFSDAEYWAKYEACVQGFLNAQQAQSLRQQLEGIRTLPSIRSLTAQLAWTLPKTA